MCQHVCHILFSVLLRFPVNYNLIFFYACFMSRCCCGNIPHCHLDKIISFFHYMAFITVTDIRHRHLSTDDIHQINKSIKPFVADKKSASVQFDSREDANDLWLEETGLLFFISPWDETFCANDVSWYEHNADVGVCHEDAYNSPCPWPPSQEGSKHSEVTPWAVSCQTRDPHYHWGVAWSWIEAEGYTTLLCFWWCHSHTREKTHSLHQSEPQIHARCTSLQHDCSIICSSSI